MATEKTKAELQTQLDALWERHANVGRDLKSASSIIKEIQSTERGIADYDAIAEKSLRDTACIDAAKSLGSFKMGDIAKGIVLTGTLRKTDTGWDDLKIGVTIPDSAIDQFHALFPLAAFENLKTVKGVSFSIGPNGATVEPTGRKATSGGGGGGGKGYRKNGGETVKLAEVFNAYATDAQKSDIVGMDGNASYLLKSKVAKDAGFAQNGG